MACRPTSIAWRFPVSPDAACPSRISIAHRREPRPEGRAGSRKPGFEATCSSPLRRSHRGELLAGFLLGLARLALALALGAGVGLRAFALGTLALGSRRRGRRPLARVVGRIPARALELHRGPRDQLL